MKAHGIKRDVKLCGIDALPIPGGGMQLVKDRILLASCIYPTQGDKVLELAMNILEGRPYQRDNSLNTALVTQNNAAALMMLSDETASEQENSNTFTEKSTAISRNTHTNKFTSCSL